MDRFQTDQERLAYLLTDNNTAIDNLPRFPVNFLMPIGEMLKSK